MDIFDNTLLSIWNYYHQNLDSNLNNLEYKPIIYKTKEDLKSVLDPI